jgi:hypothetical protein
MRRCAFVKLISGAVATWPVLLFAVPALWLFTGCVPANAVTTNTYEGPEQRITFRSPHLTASFIRAQT